MKEKKEHVCEHYKTLTGTYTKCPVCIPAMSNEETFSTTMGTPHCQVCHFEHFGIVCPTHTLGQQIVGCSRCFQNTNTDKTLTPLGEALQTKCPRCDMRWIIHNCPKYPKLLDAVQMIRKIARGAVLQEIPENADYFCSVKFEGEEFNVYVRVYDKVL